MSAVVPVARRPACERPLPLRRHSRARHGPAAPTPRPTAPSAASARRRPQFAMERHVDHVARSLGPRPAHRTRAQRLRRRRRRPQPARCSRSSVSALACLEEAARRTDFRGALATVRGRPVRPGAGRRRGGARPQPVLARRRLHRQRRAAHPVPADVALARRGELEVRIAATDMGQGTLIAFAQIARPRRAACRCSLVRTALPDTAMVPDSGPTVASRTMMVVGELVARASRASSRPSSRTSRASASGRRRCATAATSCRPRGEASRSASSRASTSPPAGAASCTAAYEPLPGPGIRRGRPTAAWRTRPSAGAAMSSRSRSTPTPSRPASSRPLAVCEVGPRDPPRAVRRPGRGRHAAGPRLGRPRGDEDSRVGATSTTAWRPTSSRPRSTRPRIEAVLLENPGPTGPPAPRASASCPWTAAPRAARRHRKRHGAELTELPATPERLLVALQQQGAWRRRPGGVAAGKPPGGASASARQGEHGR